MCGFHTPYFKVCFDSQNKSMTVGSLRLRYTEILFLNAPVTVKTYSGHVLKTANTLKKLYLANVSENKKNKTLVD